MVDIAPEAVGGGRQVLVIKGLRVTVVRGNHKGAVGVDIAPAGTGLDRGEPVVAECLGVQKLQGNLHRALGVDEAGLVVLVNRRQAVRAERPGTIILGLHDNFTRRLGKAVDEMVGAVSCLFQAQDDDETRGIDSVA